jgi:hypothetical protein
MEHRVQIFRLNKRGKREGNYFFIQTGIAELADPIGKSGNSSTCNGV